MNKFKQLGGDPDWWKGGVIYQVYPRSYQDTNDDGIGDLRGIYKRLDYIASLGVDAIWISPFFQSPMKDFGYDISDYKAVDPIFGSLDDFDLLLEKAHSLGLRIMIDLVVSHSSDQHAWFVESRQNRDNSKADWYIWSDPKPDGTPPNNWLSIFGGSAWEWDTRREQYYMHNFLTSQPDFNFHNPKVVRAVHNIARFWLDRGVDGFRMDTINFYMHDEKLRDNPPLSSDLRNDSTAPSVNPYNYQDHIYSKSHPHMLEFLKGFRALLNEYPAVAALGEVGESSRGLEILGQYTRGRDGVHMCYSFEFLSERSLDAKRFYNILEDFKNKAGLDAYSCWALSNHDVVRHRTRMDLDEKGLKLINTFMMTLLGAVCLYQGEELGFIEAEIAYEDIQDPYGRTFWPEYKGRDGCRAPMVWDGSEFGGFSSVKPWLPVCRKHVVALEDEMKREDGVLAHYRKVIALRKAHPALRLGGLKYELISDDVLMLVREDAQEKITAYFNFSNKSATIDCNAKSDLVLFGNPEFQKLGCMTIEPQDAVMISHNKAS